MDTCSIPLHTRIQIVRRSGSKLEFSIRKFNNRVNLIESKDTGVIGGISGQIYF